MILSAERFVPHTLQHLIDVRAFPNPLPEVAYNKMLVEYEAISDVSVQRIVYDSGGLKVTGMMALPPDMQPGKHPVLIYNRGGSREYGKLTVLSALRSMVPYARRGYLVLASNYRGNDGSEGKDQFGGDDVNDVLNLLELAKQNPAWDGRNAYMIGHSRGGMMTFMALRRGAEVNAAVAIAGVSNAHVLAREQPMIDRVLVPLIPGYEADPQGQLSARSPIDWPQDVNVPVLVLHGDNDKDVAFEASVAIFEALRAQGKVTELKIYPGGNHALLHMWDEVVADCFAWMERFRR